LARIDDYAHAFELAAESLREKTPRDVALNSGVDYDPGKSTLHVTFINRPVDVKLPEITLRYHDSEEVIPLTEQVLILHYLNRADGKPLDNELITYREVPAGEFYYAAFLKRAELPLLKAFGAHPERLADLAPVMGGQLVKGQGDMSVQFPALPCVPITLVIWGGDEEFEPTGKVLFDKSISHYLSTEDIAWLSGMIVYRLMRLA
jgi:hypothetical protein